MAGSAARTRHVAVAALLEQAAVARMMPFELGERRERIGNALQIALG